MAEGKKEQKAGCLSILLVILIIGGIGKIFDSCGGSDSEDIVYTNNAQTINSTDHTINVDYTIRNDLVYGETKNILELIWNISSIHKSSKQVVVTIYADLKTIGIVDAYGKIINETKRIEQIKEDLDEIRKFESLSDLQYGSFKGQLKFTKIANAIGTGRKRWFLDGEKYGLW